MAWTNQTTPNLPDFILFVRDSMQIPVLALPDASPYFEYAFNRARGLVISVPCAGGLEYTIAVYNCGGHVLIRITPDQPGRTFFADLRTTYRLNQFAAGVVQFTSDQGTSTSLSVPASLQGITIGDLGFLSTPWGREYLSYNQDFGAIAGLS